MEVLKCPSCGAHISKKQVKCLYCDSEFKIDNSVEPKPNVNKEEVTKQEIKPITLTTVSPPKTSTSEKSKGPNIIMIVIWLIIFWPIGLILLFAKIINFLNN